MTFQQKISQIHYTKNNSSLTLNSTNMNTITYVCVHCVRVFCVYANLSVCVQVCVCTCVFKALTNLWFKILLNTDDVLNNRTKPIR